MPDTRKIRRIQKRQERARYRLGLRRVPLDIHSDLLLRYLAASGTRVDLIERIPKDELGALVGGILSTLIELYLSNCVNGDSLGRSLNKELDDDDDEGEGAKGG